MEITLGIRDAAAPLALDIDMTAEELTEAVNAALNDQSTLQLKSHDNSTVIVPANAIAYVRIANNEQRRVGFGFV
ncbi:MAG: DUF3107 domain-containing protein [Actinomycetaceae bacterium]|nr:DUF3107 domain-containing protein [Arcanobacterium sp.]MDD7504360.1 DUF3107 domain-containing protein [Actinomycetaceae bacterium]MDY6143024.1 DUF3107 domain-containing protein [Arcanobacterium sp.]